MHCKGNITTGPADIAKVELPVPLTREQRRQYMIEHWDERTTIPTPSQFNVDPVRARFLYLIQSTSIKFRRVAIISRISSLKYAKGDNNDDDFEYAVLLHVVSDLDFLCIANCCPYYNL